jgi:hypothetical protein
MLFTVVTIVFVSHPVFSTSRNTLIWHRIDLAASFFLH